MAVAGVTPPKILTIAGSDSSGGAGIQADLKTFTSLGGYGSSVLTAITSQNTLGVDGIVGMEADFVTKQLKAVLNDVGTDAIKIGMLYSPSIISSISSTLKEIYPGVGGIDSKRLKLPPIVLDPVMITTTGHLLTSSSSESPSQSQSQSGDGNGDGKITIQAQDPSPPSSSPPPPHPFIKSLLSNLLPLTTIITPNLPETFKLLNLSPSSFFPSSSSSSSSSSSLEFKKDMEEKMKSLAKKSIIDSGLGLKNVLIKGGHASDYWTKQKKDEDEEEEEIVDVLLERTEDENDDDGMRFTVFKHRKLSTPNTHGTGCTLSSAIATYLGFGLSVKDSVTRSIEYVQSCLESSTTSFSIGKGLIGPVNHLSGIVKRVVPLPTPLNPHPFTHLLINQNQSNWKKYTKSHPFVKELKEGNLDRDRFLFFLRQDYIFLTHYARINALAAYKSEKMEEIENCLKIVESIVKESKKHVETCKKWGISEKEFRETEEGNMTMAYTRYVLTEGSSHSLLRLRVATAPCLLGYGEIGKWMCEELDRENDKGEGNEYIEWIRGYGGEEFQEAVKIGRDLLEQMVIESPLSQKELEELIVVFGKATRLEIGFWEQAWKMEY